MRRIYTFASDAPSQLFAFAGDSTGSALPEKHGPWKSISDIGPLDEIPHRLDRRSIEQAIHEHGYQMWRMKKES